ncbi:MAG TPA: hypothetical protein VJJ72_00335 [Candidatus Paceibacterota bacterium]
MPLILYWEGLEKKFERYIEARLTTFILAHDDKCKTSDIVLAGFFFLIAINTIAIFGFIFFRLGKRACRLIDLITAKGY